MSALLTETQLQVVKRAAERITMFPETYDQNEWFGARGGFSEPSPRYLAHQARRGSLDVEEMARCNTVACAAGHIVCAAIELGTALPDTESVSAAAQELAGLTDSQASALFYKYKDRPARKAVVQAARRGCWRVTRGRALIGVVADKMACRL